LQTGTLTFTQSELRGRKWTRAAIKQLKALESCSEESSATSTGNRNASLVYAECEVLNTERVGRHRIVAKQRVPTLVRMLIEAVKAESSGGVQDIGVQEQTKLAVESLRADLLDKLDRLFNLQFPWRVARIELSGGDVFQVHVGHAQNALWPCRKCYRPCPAYDYAPLAVWKRKMPGRPAMWGRMPRVRCPKHGIYQVSPRTKSVRQANAIDCDEEPVWVFHHPDPYTFASN